MVGYEFRLDSGEVVVDHLGVNDMPSVGQRVKLSDGRMGTRILSLGQSPKVEDVEHVDFQHHRDHHFNDDERCLKGPDGKRAYPRVNEKGQPVWRNKREIEEAKARMGWSYGDVDGPA